MRNHGSRYRSSYTPYVGSHIPSLLPSYFAASRTLQAAPFFSFHTFLDHISVMKRMWTIALPALALISVYMLLGRDYITHYSQLSTSRKGCEIYAVLNNATSRQTLKVLPLPANRAAKNQTSEGSRLEAQKTPTSLAAATTTQLQYTLAVEFRSLVETASRLPNPSKLMSYKVGDPKLLREAPRYLQAIMDSSDISFPRLSCPSPTHNRYGYLKQTPLSTPPKPKYFFCNGPIHLRPTPSAPSRQHHRNNSLPPQSLRVGRTTAHTRSYTRSPLNSPP
jgi:hypothetical protein